MKFRIQLIRKKSMISGVFSVWLPYLIILGIIVSVESSFSKEAWINNNNAVNLYYANNGKSNSLTLIKPINGNASIAIQGTTDYQAYGVHSDTLNTNVATNFSYNGEYQDPSSDLVYLRARDYDAGTQRFITQDNANVWNKYNFADSNPIMNIDPSGHMSKEAINTILGISLILAGIATPWLLGAFAPAAEATVASVETTEVASVETTDSFVTANEPAADSFVTANEDDSIALANNSVSDSSDELFKAQSMRYGLKSYPVTFVGNGIQALIQRKTMTPIAYLEMGLEDIGGAFGTLGMINPSWAKSFGLLDNGLEGVATALSAETVGASSMLSGVAGGFGSGGVSGWMGGFFVKNMWEPFLKCNLRAGTKFLGSVGIFAARGATMETAREGVMSAVSGENDMSIKNILMSSGVTAVEGGMFTMAELNFHSLQSVRSYAFTYNMGGAVFQVGIPFLI
ncbi:RHS repeat-associated core domain-containing protein [Cysteiniphilum sp. QT6929]|uniref:RHS repeat-associated core domain-containing protein n=1 Tax=Cysteiniphilum sp. QT6929 TaxID=2975055 RepID=UPI0024B34E1E|nr:RHS repeat-associated core domain-containing protein [Cysteiniphilum sp. QT6929]WHN66014.1 RHS repeat-associated core domain-containing protein [Cysteiniphilum sp. QT6929]